MCQRGLRRIIADWKLGRRLGYPVCCVAHFCWDTALGWPSGVVRWRQIEDDPKDSAAYVVCGVMHSGGSQLSLRQRVWRVARFQWLHLLPTAAGRRRREVAMLGGASWRQASGDLKVWATRNALVEELYWDESGLSWARRRSEAADRAVGAR